ncbi:hypothetical protein F9K80_10860 [Brucella intermedia]|nr:hypothetical protein F9K80_10860 [Brucella intermedia]
MISHYPTQNRFALLLEMHSCVVALSYAKPLRTFAGNAFLFCRIILRKSLRAFAGNALKAECPHGYCRTSRQRTSGGA